MERLEIKFVFTSENGSTLDKLFILNIQFHILLILAMSNVYATTILILKIVHY